MRDPSRAAGRRRVRAGGWLLVLVLVASGLLASCGNDDGARTEARDACLSAASTEAAVGSDDIELDAASSAVELDDGWGFSGTAVTPEGDRAFVCKYIDGEADVTMGTPD